MATQQGLEYNQMNLNVPGPSASQNAGRGARIAESQPEGRPSEQRVEVTVLRAVNVPSIKKYLIKKRTFFITASNHETTAKTADVAVEGHVAKWNQILDLLVVQPSSNLTLSLYAKRSAHPDILIGTHEISIPLASQSDVPCVLGGNGTRGAARSQPVTLYITITITPPILDNSPPSIPTEGNESPAEVATFPGRIQSPSPEHLLPLSHYQPVETEITMSQSLEEVTDPRSGIHQTDEAMKRVDRSNACERAVRRIKWVMDTLSPIAELFPLAKMAHSLLLTIPQTLLEQYERDDNVHILLQAMHDAFDFAHHEDTLKSVKPQSEHARILTLMLQDVCSCCDFIQSYAKESQFWKRTLKNIGGGREGKIKELSDGLVKRRNVFLGQATISTEITAFQILDDVANISTQLQYLSSQVSDVELDAKIREIPYGFNSRFSPDKGCLIGTRVAFLEFIFNWVNDPASERGLVLFGQAGTGKSSIAHEIARMFENMHRLTSSFIFSRSEQSERKASYHFFTTLARNLADRFPSFKIALGEVVKDKTDLRVGTRDYRTLFEYLILEPLKDLHIVGPILVVIDALDESGDTTSRIGLHAFLAENLKRLPSNFRVVITSRPEHTIVTALARASSVNIKYMNDAELASETHGDILAFFQQRLPSNEFGDYLEALAAKAEGLFQWAAVASQLILDPPARFGYSNEKCIKHLLAPSTNRHGQDLLDGLYKEVLEGYFTDQEARVLFRSIVGQVITSIEPLTIRSLIPLQQFATYDKDSDAAVTGVLSRLGSLLSNVNLSDKILPIIPLHTSFRDFLTNEDKSGDFYVSVHDIHGQLAHSCLNLLLDPLDGLKFNICKLEISYLANDDVEDLTTRVDKHLPPALLYACRFWDDHLKQTDFRMDLFGKVETFFKERFLFWLEALSLTRNIGLAPSAFATLNMWLASSQGDSRRELEAFGSFVNDAAIFVRHFGMAMAKSAPHIYLSALPFAPTCSMVSTQYSTSFRRILHVGRGQLSHWPSLEMTISNFEAIVLSVKFSPDGQYIVSASHDGTIRVWNATTGETAAGPFTGHTDYVNSVAFSPDGRYIASGSADETIRVWNAMTGETTAGPFTGHIHSVRSVAFSPDGQRIASGSDDETIRVWYTMTGETAAGPFTGHTNWVNSVAFSPDGQLIASGSDDKTIRVWNAMTGKTTTGAFTGHTNSVMSVAFSPDGRHIVSGSDDKTIRVWDTMTGATAAGPFRGHTNQVNSVVFSPDGEHVVSGSDDETIRLWNAKTGETTADPFAEHAHSVFSVAFSPDGRRIVSGSGDQTIRVWNVVIGETAAGPFTGHTDRIRSVALSPDGRHIVSGSGLTVHVWNTMTGESVAGPFTGHTDGVMSVVFSPDGQHIFSGSHDKTIRVWDSMTGETAAAPFIGHRGSILSVAFSPDGRHIVSGSDDETIRVWNVMTGETVAGPFTGHTRSVNSVAFSPDGQQIVSGSNDFTIRVWNAMTGGTAAGPFTGHTRSVNSVAFSPDGRHIVSGSFDYKIRVWNAITGETVAGPFIGHTRSVNSVAFSPDGHHIVSGSVDHTIRVWNAMTGEMAAGPFAGHTDLVNSVAFSPDGQFIISGSDDQTIRMSNVAIWKTETTNHVDFTDDFTINDEGWVCGNEGELLLWIPSVHREFLQPPSTIWISGKQRGTILNLSNFVHGRSWATCIN